MIFTVLPNLDISGTKIPQYSLFCALQNACWSGEGRHLRTCQKKSARCAPPAAYVGGSKPPAVLNENSLPVSSIGCIIIWLWYVCDWKIGKYAHRKIISKALDWKNGKKNKYNIKLGFLFHITYPFLPKEGIWAHKKGKEHKWCFLLDVGIKHVLGQFRLLSVHKWICIHVPLNSSQDHLPFYSKMMFNRKGYMPLIRIVGGTIRSCIGHWSLDFCHKSPSCSPDGPFLCDTMKNVAALCCSSPLCDGEIRIILTNLYNAQIPHCWCNISSVLHHSVIEDMHYIICGNKIPNRCNRWIFIADLIACSTCFGHSYAHHQELESIIQVVAACRIRCLVFKMSVWCVRFAGCSPQTGHITLSSTPYRHLENQASNTTGSNHLYNTLELLMMGIMVPETCWASNKICNCCL